MIKRTDKRQGGASWRKTSARTHYYVLFCRLAAAAFLGVAVYTLTAKLPSGDLAGDWLHTVLHAVTGAGAVYLGWSRPHHGDPRIFTWSVIVGYGALGILGWFVDGLAMGSSFQIPLMAADNVFHLLLSVTGVIAGVIAERQ